MATTNSCPCCGRAYPKPKAVTPSKPLSEMTDAELRAHYAKTAHVEDVRFHVRLAAGRADEGEWLALLEQVETNGSKATPATRLRYLELCQDRREHHLQNEIIGNRKRRADTLRAERRARSAA